jgi:Xaa-Pro aminopeptidase
MNRITSLKSGLKRAGLDAVILRLPENIVMSFGTWPMNGFSYAVFTAADGPVALIAPSCEDEDIGDCWASDIRFFVWPRLDMPDPQEAIRKHLRELAKKLKLTRARIGYEGSFECIAPAHNAGEVMAPCETSIAFLKSILPGARWSDATNVLHAQRAIKTPHDIANLRKAHRIAGMGLELFQASVRPGITEADLASRVYAACLTRGVGVPGVRHINVYPQISSGPNAHRAWRPVVTTGKRAIKSGETVVLEMAVCVDGYWADVTRVKIAGKARPVQREAYAAVLKAQETALQSIKAGMTASRVHERATEVLIDAGFAKQVTHLTGHGVGFRYHEPEPFLMPGNAQKLRVGHVCTVEPGLYDRAWGGIRIEDNVVVTSSGIENLTRAPKTL